MSDTTEDWKCRTCNVGHENVGHDGCWQRSAVCRPCEGDVGTAWAWRPLGHCVSTWPRDSDWAGSRHGWSAPAAILPHLLAAGKPPAACATRMKALEQEALAPALAGPYNGQSSRCRERQRIRFYTAWVACARISQNFLSKNTCSSPTSLAAARVTLWRHGPSLRPCSSSTSNLLWPKSLITHSDKHCSFAPALVTRSSPPFITLHSPPLSPQPESLAAARRHPPRPAATGSGPSR